MKGGNWFKKAARRAGLILLLMIARPLSTAAAQPDAGVTLPRQAGSQVQILPPQRSLPPSTHQSAPDNELQIPSMAPPQHRPDAPAYGGSQSAQTIPQAFFGCWVGESLPSDSSAYLGGCPPGDEVSEFQKLCFTRMAGGQYKIAFQSAAAALPHFQDRTELTSSQGESVVILSDVGSYEMSRLSVHVTFDGSSRCELSVDKEVLSCRGTTDLRCNGLPWYRTTGRTIMRRVAP